MADIRVLSVHELSRHQTGEWEEALRFGAESVFWETANTSVFESEDQRSAFREKYFGYYLTAEPKHFLIAFADDSRPTVLGYICGVAETRRHRALYGLAEHIPMFDDLYDEFPAHLHINLTAASRGRGLGTRLLEEFSDRMAAAGAAGVHLVTSTGARNVSFYRRAGFAREEARPLPAIDGVQEVSLLFLGKRLR
jgi:ribosomal protein S18 acetylase RimI-like enzyme